MPLTSGVLIRVPPYFRCLHQNDPLHQVSLSECPHYNKCPYQSAPLHQVSFLVSPLTSGAPTRMPPTSGVTVSDFFHQKPSPECPHQRVPLLLKSQSMFSHQSALLHQVRPSEYPLSPGRIGCRSRQNKFNFHALLMLEAGKMTPLVVSSLVVQTTSHCEKGEN